MQSAEHWTQYWRGGHTQSCFNAGKPIDTAPVWSPFFAALPVGARILDLACGAGAVARMAVEAGRGFDIVGVDFAASIAPVEGVRFVQETSLEALPFANASFDALVSQFGFEYADVALATIEAVRVLAPRGRLQLLTHAREGGPARDIPGRLARVRTLLADDGFAQALLSYGRAINAGQATRAMEDELSAVRQRALAADQDATTRRALAFLSDVFTSRRMFGGAYVVEKTTALVLELNQYADRLQEMVGATLSRDGAEELSTRFTKLGLDMLPLAVAEDDTGQIGWILSGTSRG